MIPPEVGQRCPLCKHLRLPEPGTSAKPGMRRCLRCGEHKSLKENFKQFKYGPYHVHCIQCEEKRHA